MRDRVPGAAGMTAILYVIRHGSTRLNTDGRLRGRVDEPLDDVGRTQAGALAALFQSVPVEVIVSSPLLRAQETAAPIVSATGALLEINDVFTDRDWGRWSGCATADIIG